MGGGGDEVGAAKSGTGGVAAPAGGAGEPPNTRFGVSGEAVAGNPPKALACAVGVVVNAAAPGNDGGGEAVGVPGGDNAGKASPGKGGKESPPLKVLNVKDGKGAARCCDPLPPRKTGLVSAKLVSCIALLVLSGLESDPSATRRFANDGWCCCWTDRSMLLSRDWQKSDRV